MGFRMAMEDGTPIGAPREGQLKYSAIVTIAKITTNDKFILARVNGVYVYSCYASPNASMVQFQDLLYWLERSVRLLEQNAKIIIAGDFNSRSVAWGD